ncbi:hypothetical protein ACOSP7_009767 [Xanthoceras sorbifolium]
MSSLFSVRGKKVEISPALINEYFGLVDNPEEEALEHADIFYERHEEMARDICMDPNLVYDTAHPLKHAVLPLAYLHHTQPSSLKPSHRCCA